MDFNQIDHLLFGGPDLDQTTKAVHELLGMAPVTGGSHPGKGTRNQLLGLSHGAYLEVIGPDPEQQVDQVWMNINQFKAPRLFRWAAKCNDLEGLRERALSKGIDIGAIQSGERQKPDGTLLKWRLTNPDLVLGDGLVPFFIDWREAGNPTPSLPSAGEIIDIYGKHPDPERVKRIFDVLEIDMKVLKGESVGLVAQISIERGIIDLS